jgi:hypothetical protein
LQPPDDIALNILDADRAGITLCVPPRVLITIKLDGVEVFFALMEAEEDVAWLPHAASLSGQKNGFPSRRMIRRR